LPGAARERPKKRRCKFAVKAIGIFGDDATKKVEVKV
jgi:hypothetical protein